MRIPMGTVVTVVMLLGTVFAIRFPAGGLGQLMPTWLTRLVGVLLGAAGLWNVLWYGLQHLTEFWGHMALGSGVAMIVVGSLLLLSRDKTPVVLDKLRPLFVLVLALFGFYYAWTIYNL